MKISEGYHQLAKVFELLESARFQPDYDFGADITSSFAWYISPPAISFLEAQSNSYWIALKNNQQFKCKYLPWAGMTGEGADIKLNI